MKKDAAVKPADPEIESRARFPGDEIGRKLTALVEDFPEDKYDLHTKAEHPRSWSFAEQLLGTWRVHATTSRILRMGQKPPAGEAIRSASNTSPRLPTSLRSSRSPSPMAQTAIQSKAREKA